MKKIVSLLLIICCMAPFAACKEKATLQRGETKNGVHTNAFAELTFKSPKDWQFASNEELLANSEHPGTNLDTERLVRIYEEVGIAYDMSCYNKDYENSVGLLFANLEHEELKRYSSAEDFLHAMIEQTGLDTSAGISEDEVTLCGKTYLRLCAESKTATGATGYATFYGRKQGSTVIVIVAACTDKFSVKDCESCFI